MEDVKTDTVVTYYVAERDGQLFGIDAAYVSESLYFERLTPLPGTRSELSGVVNLRNTVLPVVLVDRWLLTPQIAYDPQKPVAVLRVGKVSIAIQFDIAHGVHTVSETDLYTHPYRAETGYFSSLVRLEDGRLFTAIDAEMLVAEINTLTA